MYQIPHGDKWAIIPDGNELFFELFILDTPGVLEVKEDSRQYRPRIFSLLAEWLDTTCPGRWTTGIVEGREAIILNDENIFSMFKLAWHNDSYITIVTLNGSGIYCPYIPLVTTSAHVAKVEDE